MSAKFRNLAASQAIFALKSLAPSRSLDHRTVAGKMRIRFDRNSRIFLSIPVSVLVGSSPNQSSVVSDFVDSFPVDGNIITGLCMEQNSPDKKREEAINFFLSRPIFAQNVLDVVSHRDGSYKWMRNALFQDSSLQRVVVEYSSPNIAKPFHVGHLRSALVGNFVCNIHEAVGHDVTRINYLGDWGTQFGFVSAGMELANITMDDIKKDPVKQMLEVYINANNLAKENKEIAQRARDEFNKLESGDDKLRSQWQKLRQYSIEELEKTYKRLNINFDHFHGESMYGTGEDEEIMKQLDDKKLLEIQENGAKVIRLNEDNKVTVVKSDGSSLYISRDIAAAVDRFDKFTFDKMIYVVDNSQAPHFKNLFQILNLLGHAWSGSCHHVRFGKILGMSTRRGNLVLMSDVLDEARDIMVEQQDVSRNTRLEEGEREAVADNVGISAVIVNDLKQRRTKDYKFDWHNFMKHTGDTGVKLQYTHARLTSLIDNSGMDVDKDCCTDGLVEQIAIDIVVLLGRWDEVLSDSYHQLEPCIIVQYLFKLCNKTSKALTLLNVKNSGEEVARARLLLFYSVRVTLGEGLRLLGITPLDKM